MDIKFTFNPSLLPSRYSDDPGFDLIIEAYQDSIKEDTPFLLPIQALRTIRNLKTLASNRLLLLSGDKGIHTISELKLCSDHRPVFADCGDANVSVNVHAMKLYTEFLGGFLIDYPRPPDTDYEKLYFSNWLIYFNKPGTRSQDFFYSLFVNGYTPIECYKMTNQLLSGKDAFAVNQILSFFSLSHYDPQLLYFYKTLDLQKLFYSLQEANHHVQYEIMKKVEKHFFWVNRNDNEIGYLLAQAFYYMKQFAHCKNLLHSLIELSGDSAQYRYFLGMCYHEEGKKDRADLEFKRTLELDPSHPYAEKFLT